MIMTAPGQPRTKVRPHEAAVRLATTEYQPYASLLPGWPRPRLRACSPSKFRSHHA
jgi:hypothetical protein